MSAFTTATSLSTSASAGPAFWERLWRLSGINFIVFFIAAYLIYGHQPQAGASADTLVSFYDSGRTRILIATVLSGMALLNLLWFVAALRTTLADAGRDGWGAAATTSSAVLGALVLLLLTLGAAPAYSIADSGIRRITAELNDLAWACYVLTSFPRAMLIMAGTFGLWRAGQISNTLFAVGVAAVVLVVLGGTTWTSNGFWAPDGAYSRFVSPIIGLLWVLFVSRVLLSRSPATRAGW